VKRALWRKKIMALPKGLTVVEAAMRLGTEYDATRKHLKRCRYKPTKSNAIVWTPERRQVAAMRSTGKVVDWRKVNWSKRDADIVRLIPKQYGFAISRQAVSKARRIYAEA
jgi:hypothetical protein